MSCLAHLSIKWIVVEKVGAVEPLTVGLLHGDPVLSPLEYLHLVHREDVGPSEVSLSGDVNLAVSVLQPYSFVEISVLHINHEKLYIEIGNALNIM